MYDVEKRSGKRKENTGEKRRGQPIDAFAGSLP